MLLELACLFTISIYFSVWNFKNVKTDSFFCNQRWNINEAISFIIIYGASPYIFNVILIATQKRELFIAYPILLLPICLLTLWTLYLDQINQPLSVLGLSKNNLYPMLAVGFKWLSLILLIEFSLSSLELGSLEKNILETGIQIYDFEVWGNYWKPTFVFTVFSIDLILGSVIEEILVRGFLYGALRKYLDVQPSNLISSGLFMLGHDRFQLGMFLYSYFLTLLYEKNRSLIPCIVLHVGLNLQLYILFWLFHYLHLNSLSIFYTGASGCFVIFSFSYYLLKFKYYRVRK